MQMSIYGVCSRRLTFYYSSSIPPATGCADDTYYHDGTEGCHDGTCLPDVNLCAKEKIEPTTTVNVEGTGWLLNRVLP